MSKGLFSVDQEGKPYILTTDLHRLPLNEYWFENTEPLYSTTEEGQQHFDLMKKYVNIERMKEYYTYHYNRAVSKLLAYDKKTVVKKNAEEVNSSISTANDYIAPKADIYPYNDYIGRLNVTGKDPFKGDIVWNHIRDDIYNELKNHNERIIEKNSSDSVELGDNGDGITLRKFIESFKFYKNDPATIPGQYDPSSNDFIKMIDFSGCGILGRYEYLDANNIPRQLIIL